MNNIVRDWLFVMGVLSVRSGPVGLGWRRRTPLFEFLLFVNFMIHNESLRGVREYVDWIWALGRMKFYLGHLGVRLPCGSWNKAVLGVVESC